MTQTDTRLPVAVPKARLDACPLPEAIASAPDDLADFPNPFPAGRQAEEAA
jgi:hypothetical protein